MTLQESVVISNAVRNATLACAALVIYEYFLQLDNEVDISIDLRNVLLTGILGGIILGRQRTGITTASFKYVLLSCVVEKAVVRRKVPVPSR